VVRLSIILGHSEIGTTMKYLHLLTEDLQRPHQSLSILNRLAGTRYDEHQMRILDSER